MELKGFINVGSSINPTCCTTITDILIGENSLFEALEKLFPELDAGEFFEGVNKESKKLSVKYIIQNDKPKKEKPFNHKAAHLISEMIAGSYVSGCYSEWTCGFGGFDYVLNNEKSIFSELENHLGRYIHLIIE